MPYATLNDFSRETGIGNQTNIEIPLILQKVDSDYKRLIGEINKVRKIRNNIVHKGIDVTPLEVGQAISTITEFVEYLNNYQTPAIRHNTI